MYGLFAAFGSAARRFTRETLTAAVNQIAPSSLAFLRAEEEMVAAVFTPRSAPATPACTWSSHGKLGIGLDGYLVTDSSIPGSHLPRVLEEIGTRGITPALRSIVSGSFNLLLLDTVRGRLTVANDRLGSIPLYYAKTVDGCLVSTHPTLLRTSGLISHEIDQTACAELAYIGYTIGNRYFLRDIHLLPPASLLTWNVTAHTCEISPTGLTPFAVLPTSDTPDLDEIAAQVRTACRRLSRLGGRTAHLQSGGMDSRLILAAWPKEEVLPCYTYGHSDLAEVTVACSIAQTRSAPFTHVDPDGDAVAACLDKMFLLNGPSIYPATYVTARTIRDDGFDNVLDGLLADVLIGGLFYSSLAHFSTLTKYARSVNVFVDHRVSKIGLDAIAETMFKDIVDPDTETFLHEYLNTDVALALSSERPRILQDIYTDLKRLVLPNDSLALLVRNFNISNRTQHSIVHQGSMCRQFLQVYYPLSNDFSLLETLLKLEPRVTAYHALYIDLYKRQFPAYAELPYAASLLPLKRPSWRHLWSTVLLKRGIRIPFVTGNPSEKVLHVNKWDRWLKESSVLRAKTVILLAESGLGNTERLASRMDEIAQGQKSGCGDIAHLAGLGSYLTLPLSASSTQAA